MHAQRFTAEEKAKRPQLCYMPFGFGPRNCVGMRFAMLEAKIALIEVLRKFTFVRCPETEVRSIWFRKSCLKWLPLSQQYVALGEVVGI